MTATRALPLLILRGEPGASVTAARAEALGLTARKIPLFAVEPVAWDVPDARDFDRLLLTSANAVRHAGAGLAALRGLPCWCVGAVTAAAARGAGLTVERVGTSDAASLLADAPASLRLLWLTDEQHDEKSLTFDVRDSILCVYRTRALAIDPGALNRPAVALVHSARAAQRLAEIGQVKGQVALVAISPAVAAAAGSGWREVRWSDTPDDTEMLAIAAKLCHDAPGQSQGN
ncbi:MAG: uroporphyrinogen-III synthase [Sphingopyxis sp.]